MKLYNSLTKKIENFTSIKPKEARIYSCGPTVYSYAHIGNMRAFLFADLLQRTLKVVEKYNVQWVMNITNIDDKTIRDSKIGSNAWLKQWGIQSGNPMQDLTTLTSFYEQEFIKDISKIGINKNDIFAMPKATEYIPQMQQLILNILKKGFAYIAGDSIYFNVNEYKKTEKYGKLFKIDFNNFQTGLRIDTDQYEREQVSDFVVWKGKKDNEPYWNFYINDINIPGRPGWHIECSAMEHNIFGLPFDIHTGGIDLKFPHHEDEIAQSKAGYGIEPTNYFCHNEFLEVEGNKMSKSLGNFFTIRDLENKDINPLDIRFAMLSVHYRTKYNFTINGIDAAKKAKNRMQEYIYSALEKINYNIENNITTDKIKALRNNIFNKLTDDLHTPKALAYLFDFINKNAVNSLYEDEIKSFIYFMKEINEIFAIWNFNKLKPTENNIPQDIINIAQKRLDAKKQKDFATADKLRNEIVTLGYNILDTKEGFNITKI